MKVLVTGASGYVARVTLPHLLDDDQVSTVYGLDVRPPGIEHPKFVFIERDVRSEGMEDVMCGVDVLVHMAFIVSEIKDKKKIYDINVNGTRRVLDAVKAAGIRRLVVASSVSAYGSRPRGGNAVTEETPLRANENAYYSHTKGVVEGMVDEFEKDNPGIAVARLRPSILCGKQTDNFFLDLIAQPVLVYPSCNPEGLPLVHEDDVGRAFHLATKSHASGAFNIVAGSLPFRKMGEILGRRAVGLPYGILKPVSDIGFWLGLSPVSSHWVVLGRHPFHVDCARAEKLLGWTPQHSPEQAFREMVAAWKK